MPRSRSMDGIIKTGRPGRRRRGMERFIPLLTGFLAAFVAAGLVAAALIGYARVRLANNGTVVGGLAERKPTEPINLLLLGSDSRKDLTEDQQKSFGSIGGQRADTIILLHVNENRKKAVMVHFPRDLRVTYPDGSAGKINAVYQKGPEAMVKTVKEFTGLPITHYVEVNFNGFNNIVDTLGGVDVYFDRPLKDQDSGLNVPRGCVKVEGDQALAFVRVRKIDDDFGRIARQQLFVRLMLDKVLAPGTYLNPTKVIRLVNLFSENVKHDDKLTLGDAKDIGARLKGFDSSRLEMRVVPSKGARIGRTSYVIANEQETQALFGALRSGQDLPPVGTTVVSPVDPSDVLLLVLNGTKVDQLAKNEANLLSAEQFVTLGIGDGGPHQKTTVYYRKDQLEEAKFVGGRYSAAVKPMPAAIAAIDARAEVAVVLGEDFAAGKAKPPPPAAAAPPKALARPCP